MRLTIVLGTALSAALPAAAPAAAAPAAAAERRLEALADVYVAARLERDPDVGYIFGVTLPERAEGRLDDRSPGGLARFDASVDGIARALPAIDRSRLDHDHRILHALLSEEVAGTIAMRACHREWWDAGHIGGWLSDTLDFGGVEAVGTPRTRAASLRRWASLPAAVDIQIANLSAGLAHGYAAPRAVVERSIAQLDALAATPTEQSPFFSPAVRDPDPAFAARLRALVEGPARAAMLRYRRYLAETYLPRARATLGVDGLPNGAACYRGMIRRFTSLDEAPEHLFARAEAASDEGLRDALQAGAQVYGTTNLTELLAKARSDPAEHYSSPAEMMADARDTAAQARRAFLPLFVALPTQGLSVEPYPASQRGLGLPPRYRPSGDPAVAAITWVPDERFASMPRGLLRSTILHEGIPGHHLVGARMAAARRHPLMKIAYQFAYDEGWAVYSEGLADAAGMPPSPGGRVIAGINRSKDALFDIAINARGWDKARLERYFAPRGGLGRDPDDRIARIAAFPAQQLTYTAGELTIRELRAEAERRLGPRFNLAAFHEAILRDGAVPLWFLRENVEAWIAEQERRS